MDIKLTKFLPSLAEVPSKELEALKERAVKSGFDFIDFWAVDFDWQPGKPFNHHWQDYRTRKDRSLKTVSDAGHVYDEAGQAHGLREGGGRLRLRHEHHGGGGGVRGSVGRGQGSELVDLCRVGIAHHNTLYPGGQCPPYRLWLPRCRTERFTSSQWSGVRGEGEGEGGRLKSHFVISSVCTVSEDKSIDLDVHNL